MSTMQTTLELPQTAGCLVCGRDNPIGLHLRLMVDPGSGQIATDLTPGPHHIGFAGLIHGGLLATAIDEAMVWAAIWSSRRACVAAEMTVRYKHRVAVGEQVRISAKVIRARPRLIETEATIGDGSVIHCTATGKYVPLDAEATVDFIRTFVSRPETTAASELLRAG
jgi:acyl-coenzyme A thioesterase PaaI-like protein